MTSGLPIDDSTAPVTRRPAPRGLSLLVVAEREAAIHLLPPAGQVTIGRGEDCTIRVDHPSVSRRHAEIDVGPPLRIRDLGSANGTRAPGRVVPRDGGVEFEPGEVLELGGVWIVVRDAEGAPTGDLPLGSDAARAIAPPGVIVEDATMIRVFQLVERVAASDLSILVLGETGVGKEVVAEAIHRQSRRAKGPFLRLHCAALPRTLLESELFGHERGAFTGASESKPGLFESAGGGTVFLDEIGEIPPETQVALLRVVEDRKVMRVGAREPRKIDVRFVAATNRDLRTESQQGRFRSDLYYRLSGVSIRVPPLRERRSEIEPLARSFSTRAAESAGLSRPPRWTADALAALAAYGWPGNVRELRHAVEQAVVVGRGEDILPEHLPAELQDTGAAGAATTSSATLRGELDDVERRRIVEALETCSGNQTRAAQLLGMPRRTFVKRLDAYGIARPRKK